MPIMFTWGLFHPPLGNNSDLRLGAVKSSPSPNTTQPPKAQQDSTAADTCECWSTESTIIKHVLCMWHRRVPIICSPCPGCSFRPRAPAQREDSALVNLPSLLHHFPAPTARSNRGWFIFLSHPTTPSFSSTSALVT